MLANRRLAPAWLLSATGAVLPLAGAPYLGAPPRTVTAVAVTAVADRGYTVWTSDGAGHGFGTDTDVAPLADGPPTVAVSHGRHDVLRLRADGAVVTGDGAVADGVALPAGERAVAIVDAPRGHWIVGRAGSVVGLGGARSFPEGDRHDGEVVAAVGAAPAGLRLVRAWSVTDVGDVESVGPAPTRAVLGGPITGARSTAGGRGVWLLTGHGAVHGLGDVRDFPGSLPLPARDPVVDLCPLP